MLSLEFLQQQENQKCKDLKLSFLQQEDLEIKKVKNDHLILTARKKQDK